MTSLSFIGAGNMAEAMIRGLLRGNVFAPGDVVASGPRAERMRELADAYGIRTTANNREAATARIVVLSVKPQILSKVLDEVADAIDAEALVISIAAGVPGGAVQWGGARGGGAGGGGGGGGDARRSRGG